MRKFFMMVLIMLAMFFSITIVNAEEFDGYIFEPKKRFSLFSVQNNESFEYLGDGMYKAESLEEIYDTYNSRDIVKVFPNYRLKLFNISYPQVTSDIRFSELWNHSMIKAESARQCGVFGKNVKIAVIDSGLNINHSDFDRNRILTGYNCIEKASNVNDVTDDYGHGTAVTSIIAAQTDNELGIAGIASKANIIPIKITDGQYLNMSDIYNGITKAIELGADIINLSLGGPISDEDAREEFKSWIDDAVNEGITVIAAAGNEGTNLMNYPAGFDNVIGVGFINEAAKRDVLSNENESVFITAPGRNIPCIHTENGNETLTGSSVATPHVTAAVALIKQLKPNVSINEIKDILSQTATDKGMVGYDTSYGYGILNIDGIMNMLNEYLPNVIISQGLDNSVPRIHIHNNSNELTANVYFAAYDEENRLLDIRTNNNVLIPNGVKTLNYTGDFDKFFLWKDNLMPVTEAFEDFVK